MILIRVFCKRRKECFEAEVTGNVSVACPCCGEKGAVRGTIFNGKITLASGKDHVIKYLQRKGGEAVL